MDTTKKSEEEMREMVSKEFLEYWESEHPRLGEMTSSVTQTRTGSGTVVRHNSAHTSLLTN
jgi:hypothetical protein